MCSGRVKLKYLLQERELKAVEEQIRFWSEIWKENAGMIEHSKKHLPENSGIALLQ